MPLILAIEPDRRQAAQLTGVIRHHVGAELILADTTEGALVAIGRRVPDLVLVPALLAPQDDAALASALRVIAAAAHVRTLTIPAFANGVSHMKRTGLLARLGLGRKVTKAPDGCEPSVFAEQVVAYLREAAADRAAIEPTPALIEVQAAAHTVCESPEPIASEATRTACGLADAGASQTTDLSGDNAAPSNVLQTSDPIPCEATEPNAYGATESSVLESASAPAEEEMFALISVETETETSAAETGPEEEEQGIDLSEELMSLCARDGESEDEQVEVYSIDVTPEQLLGESEPEPEATTVIAEPQAAIELPVLAATAKLETIIEAPVLAAIAELEAIIGTPVLAATAKLETIIEAPVLAALAELEAIIETQEPDDVIAELQAALEEPLPAMPDEAWDETRETDEDEPRQNDVELWMPLSLARRWPALQGMVSATRPLFVHGFSEDDVVREPHVIAAAPAPVPLAPAPEPAGTSAQATANDLAKSEWVELIESLRLDIERLKATSPQTLAEPVASGAAAAATWQPARKPNRRTAEKVKPVQDEWGFFDPEQCGFAALLAKLDEITEGSTEPEARTH